ncbi:MAG: CDP-diacylglycerol--glycerol-3-phosphate 3-phosphatidyltransferase [Treponemataceae bacterium]
MNLADKFTLSRIILSPVFFIIFFLPHWFPSLPQVRLITAFIMIPLLGFMEFTDFLDGFFARRRNQVSDFGKLFDPFGDVLVHLTLFVCFMLESYMPTIIFILIIYREFGMLFIRLMAMQKGVAIGARKGGKLKTVLYVVAIFYSLIIETILRLDVDIFNSLPQLKFVGMVLYAITLLAAYLSFADYIIYFKKSIK